MKIVKIILLILAVANLRSTAQSIKFSYDNAGNRIKRYTASTPDLRPFLIMLDVSFTNASPTKSITIRVRNMRAGTTATSPITLRLYKPTHNSTLSLTGSSLSDWSVVSTTTYYELTTNIDISDTTPYNITATLNLPATAAIGQYNLRTLIPDLSGGELVEDNTNNNLTIAIFKN